MVKTEHTKGEVGVDHPNMSPDDVAREKRKSTPKSKHTQAALKSVYSHTDGSLADDASAVLEKVLEPLGDLEQKLTAARHELRMALVTEQEPRTKGDLENIANKYDTALMNIRHITSLHAEVASVLGLLATDAATVLDRAAERGYKNPAE